MKAIICQQGVDWYRQKVIHEVANERPVMKIFHLEKDDIAVLHHASKNHGQLVNQVLPRSQPQGGAIQ
jgi:hypothetical protein